MSVTCLAYQFEVEPKRGQSTRQLLGEVRAVVVRWIESFLRRSGSRLRIPDQSSRFAPEPLHELQTDRQECSTHQLSTVDWIFPDQHDPTLQWSLSAVWACDAQTLQMAFLVQVLSCTPALRLLHYRIDAPNPLASMKSGFLGNIVFDWPCRVGAQPVPREHVVLVESQVEPFVHESLLNPNRTLPVILMGPEGGAPADDEGLREIQERVLGYAQLAVLADESALKGLTNLLGAERSCAGGVRLYWPGFTRDAPLPLRDHVLRTYEQLRATSDTALGQYFFQGLSNFAADSFREGRVIRAARSAIATDQAERCRSAANAAARLAETDDELQQTRHARERFRAERDAAWQELQRLQRELADTRGQLGALREAMDVRLAEQPRNFDELARELERSWDENERLRLEMEAVTNRAEQLEAALRHSQDNLALAWADTEPDAASEAATTGNKRVFNSVADALGAAATEFADVLTVWEDATRAAEQSSFPTAAKVFRALQAVAEVGRAFFQAQQGGPSLGPVDQAFRSRVPFKYTAFESQTTLRLYGAERVFHHHEQSRQMQRHLTLGGGQTTNCLQIYFEFDDGTQRVLIGYCGRHLPFDRQRT